MRRMLIQACIAAACSSMAAAAEPSPGLVCDRPVHDFGKTNGSAVIEHAFVLRNGGGRVVVLGDLWPSPGLEVAGVSARTVPPGGNAAVSVRLPLRGRSGPQYETVAVQFKDRALPDLQLVLRGAVAGDLEVSPRQLEFGDLAPGSVATGIVEVAAYGSRELVVGRVESSNPLLAARKETVRAGRSCRIVVTTRPPLPTGALRGSIRVETNDPDNPSLNINVSGQVTAR